MVKSSVNDKDQQLSILKSVVCNNQTSSSSSSCKFKGVRKRKWGKYVSEIRLPNSRERIWLGSFDTAEKAARAFDAALFCLRGANAKFNFPDSPPEIAGGRSMTPVEIQVAASGSHMRRSRLKFNGPAARIRVGSTVWILRCPIQCRRLPSYCYSMPSHLVRLCRTSRLRWIVK
ncbi:hypothetical protein MIMGU_mgv1a014932mg [Erythranthe guttata]|uniref:AP2/ERF domain-containing protein n=1 Tax=Erythranthe guttata TaxID=4155 RepID=A0A022QP95_ERYGU|nr:PREDICTED: ethylene-responsive transcription factor ERF017-like [Erythranthe guttata]EYU28310.1 hypothetical protein MIMGU_mgv1a014932mg [Erythranthe guttata]|eukprot:XP_012848042.1 PREDICTED: ethylene-responsive transcription factor ERF017-like [Erythranthe guttata]